MVASLGAVPVLYAVAAGPRRAIRSARPGVTLAPVTSTFWLPLASGSASASSLTRVTVVSVISWARCLVRSGADHGADLRLVDEDVLGLEEAALHLQLQHPVHRLVDAVLGELTGAHRVEHRVVGDVELAGCRHQQLVDAGLQRQHRDAVVAEVVAHALHGQRVGDDDAVVAQLAAQDVGDDRLRQGRRRRRTGRAAGTTMCAVMIVSMPRSMAARNGGASMLLPLRAGVVDDRHAVVAVGRRVAVTREVLRRGGHVGAPGSRRRWPTPASDTSVGSEPNDRTPMTGFCALTLTSASGAKSWLMPIARSSLPLICARVVRVGLAASRAQRHVARQLGGRRSDPGDDSVLLVGADQQRDAGARCEVATRCRPLDRPAICSGFATLFDQAK